MPIDNGQPAIGKGEKASTGKAFNRMKYRESQKGSIREPAAAGYLNSCHNRKRSIACKALFFLSSTVPSGLVYLINGCRFCV